MGSKTLSWMGRQLESITDGENTYAYAYNMDGQRVSKTVNGTKTEFFYNGSILTGQKTGNDSLVFMYDENGDYFGFIYNGEDYYFIKNILNEIEAISDKDENIVVRYTYDAWGNVNEISGSKANTLGKLNPIRYRGYYYDSETGFYYLNSRYYSPEMCRFINADGYTQTGQGMLDKNMFSYCFNNPVQLVDPDGDCPYNGTVADFHRLEQGLPSLDCNCYKPIVLDEPKEIFSAERICDNLTSSYIDLIIDNSLVYIKPILALKQTAININSLKGISSKIGVFSAITSTVQVLWDYVTYKDDPESFSRACVITAVSLGASIFVGVAVGAITTSAPVALIASVTAGCVISSLEDKARDTYLKNYKRRERV